MSAAAKLHTYDDLLGIPEHIKAELHAGEIVTQSGTLPRHGRVLRTLGRFIGGPFDDDSDGPDGWWILPEVDVRFTPHDITRPDLSGWRRTRLASPWETRPIDVIPDWICEVLSPATQKYDRVFKHQLYARHGVPFYWLVDPAERILEAYALEAGRWVTVGTYDDGARAKIPPFDAIELPVGRLFPPP